MFLFVRNCDGYLLVGDIEQEVKGVARGCTKCLHGSAKPIKIGLGKGDVAVCPKGTLNNESLISDELSASLRDTYDAGIYERRAGYTFKFDAIWNKCPFRSGCGHRDRSCAAPCDGDVGWRPGVPEACKASVADGLNEVAKYV